MTKNNYSFMKMFLNLTLFKLLAFTKLLPLT